MTSLCLGGTVLLPSCETFTGITTKPLLGTGKFGAMRIAPEIRVRGVKEAMPQTMPDIQTVKQNPHGSKAGTAVSSHSRQGFGDSS